MFDGQFHFRLKRKRTCPNNGTREEPCKLCRKRTYRNAGKTSYSRIKVDIITLKVQGKWGRKSWTDPQHDKTKKMTCALSELSDQPGHAPRLSRVFAVRLKKGWVFSYPLSAQGRDSDQTGGMPRLIWVFAGCTGHFVDFVLLQLS